MEKSKNSLTGKLEGEEIFLLGNPSDELAVVLYLKDSKLLTSQSPEIFEKEGNNLRKYILNNGKVTFIYNKYCGRTWVTMNGVPEDLSEKLRTIGRQSREKALTKKYSKLYF